MRAGRSKTKTADAHWKRESQRLHRTLYWYVKSKLEAVVAGLEGRSQAWLPSIEGPRGHTIYEEMRQGLPAMKSGEPLSMPALPPSQEDKG